MPAQHVARAAAVLIAVSAAVVPVATSSALDLVQPSFVEVLIGPDQQDVRVVHIEGTNNGCVEH